MRNIIKKDNLLIKECGVIYTPEWIVEFMIDELFRNKKLKGNEKILDPGCGAGIFATKVAFKFSQITGKEIHRVIEENIFFIDIDKNAILKTQENLQNLTSKKIKNFNAINDDFCFYNFDENFDFIIGNPPYIRIQNLNQKRKEIQLQFLSAKSGSIDIYFCFFEKSLNLLNDKGRISFITPNSHFYSLAGQNLRKILQNHLSKIVDFDDFQVFEDATTYTAISFLNKKPQKEFIYCLNQKKDFDQLRLNLIENKNLNNKKWEFLEQSYFDKLNNIKNKYQTLEETANIHYGIATLKDDIYIFKPENEDEEYFYKDNQKIEKNICVPIIKASTYKGKNQNLYLIFPYKNEKLIKKDILQKDFPCAYQYFLSKKDGLEKRDKGGAKNYQEFYAFGRNQGLKTSFGKKIITSSMNLKPNFYVIEDEKTTFYSGYCIKPKNNMNLYDLCQILNSKEMQDYIEKTSKSYRGGYKSYAKSFIKNFASSAFEEKQKTLFDL